MYGYTYVHTYIQNIPTDDSMHTYILRLKQMLILVFKYSFGFKTISPNILLNIRSNLIVLK